MNSIPLVSVITPCFNDGAFLLDCIRSVDHSVYPNVEHIIVNDGSVDEETLNILDSIAGSEKRKVFHLSNHGVCYARNLGVAKSRGKYLLFLDGDDMISKDYISLAVSILDEKHDIAVVSCNYSFFGYRNRTVFLEEYSLEKLMGGNLFTITSMLRKEDFLRVGGFKENMALGLEDWDFWLSVLEKGEKTYYLEGVHFFYRKKKQDLSRNSSISFENFQAIRKTVYENHIELYQSRFFSIIHSFEYLMVVNSIEYRLGKKILIPIRFTLNFIDKIRCYV